MVYVICKPGSKAPGFCHMLVPVGVGSLANAVVSHFKRKGRTADTRILAFEPDTAPCLWKSLTYGRSIALDTTPTIMAGMDCGAISSISWSTLQCGIDASLTVSDYETHLAVDYLRERFGISSGPCGAATLAALLRLRPEDKSSLGLGQDSTILLLNTEGGRAYDAHRYSIA
jgi:threonine dehydratase